MSSAGKKAVDAHIHFWRLARGDNVTLSPAMVPIWRDREPEHLRPLLDAAGVERIIVVQAATTVAETLYTLGLAKRFPWIAGIVGWVDPASPSIEEELDALAINRRFRGIRPVLDDNKSIAWMLDARFERCWSLLQERGLVLEFLVQNPDEVPLVTHFASRHPALSIVLDHCAKPDIAGRRYEPWAGDIAALAACGNVACKLSGLLNRAPGNADAPVLKLFSDHILRSFGSERVLWASDWPPLELAAGYARWRTVSLQLLDSLGDHEREAVLGGNAERLYGLDAADARAG
jgi:L-fuconolactonase